MNLDFSVKPGELLLDEAAVLVVELARRLQDRRRNVVRPNVLQINVDGSVVYYKHCGLQSATN